MPRSANSHALLFTNRSHRLVFPYNATDSILQAYVSLRCYTAAITYLQRGVGN